MSKLEEMVWATSVKVDAMRKPVEGFFPSPTAKFVAAALARRAWATGSREWSQARLSADTGLSVRTIWTALQDLAAAKIIKREKVTINNLRRPDRLIFTIRAVTLTLEPEDQYGFEVDTFRPADLASTAPQILPGERHANIAEQETLSVKSITGVVARETPKERLKREAGVLASETFDAWWKLYPLKVSKPGAVAAYVKAIERIGLETAVAVLTAGVEQLRMEVADYGPDEKHLIPHPATWLNADGWLDEPGARRRSHGRHRTRSDGRSDQREDSIRSMQSGAMAALDRFDRGRG